MPIGAPQPELSNVTGTVNRHFELQEKGHNDKFTEHRESKEAIDTLQRRRKTDVRNGS